MPVPRGDDRRARRRRFADEPIDRGDDFIGAGDRQASAGAEVALDIQDEQGVVWTKPHHPSFLDEPAGRSKAL